jgi:hypothetical protein
MSTAETMSHVHEPTAVAGVNGAIVPATTTVSHRDPAPNLWG